MTEHLETPGVYVILARDEAGGIGRGGDLPWQGQFPEDLHFFRRRTMHTTRPGSKNVLVMGHRTISTLPPSIHRCPKRCVVTMDRSGAFQVPPGVDVETIFLCGGAASLRAYMSRCERGEAPWPHGLILTTIPGVWDCDVHVSDEMLCVGTRYFETDMSQKKGIVVRQYIFKSLF
jgi:dihydrofolate reductase